MSNWKNIGFRNKSLRNMNSAALPLRFSADDLKRNRLSLGLTQREVATSLCVSLRTVVSWETGARQMPLCCQRLFCMLYGLHFELLKVPLDDLHPDLF